MFSVLMMTFYPPLNTEREKEVCGLGLHRKYHVAVGKAAEMLLYINMTRLYPFIASTAFSFWFYSLQMCMHRFH